MYEYALERYLDVRGAGGATLSPDGTLSFLLDTTGVSQVWSLEEPGAWPEQRTFYDEPVSFASYSSERPELVFGMDEGGDERLQLYRLDDANRIHPLTDTPDAKHRFGGWSHDGDRIAFASNRRSEAVFDVYVQDRTGRGEAATRVWEGDGWLSVAGWGPDDERLLVSEAHSSFDQDLYVLDLDSRELTHLTPHDGTVRFLGAEWARDGEGLYLVTDYGRDTLALVYLAMADGRDADHLAAEDLQVVVEGGDWNVDGVAVDHDSDLVAYSRNVEGYTELSIGEFRGRTVIDEFPVPDLAGGVAGGVSFGPDGERIACSASGRRQNANVYVFETADLRAVPKGEAGARHRNAAEGSGADGGDDLATRWTDASTAGIPRETFVEPELVRYESVDGREIPAFLSLPRDVPEGGAPAIVDVHGGPESQRRPSFAGLTQYFLSRGYAVFEPNVRGSTGYGTDYTHLDDVEKRPDAVADLDAGAEWLASHDAVDPDRLAVKGGSYGGFMVLAAMTEYPDRWAAGVDVVGIANFVTFLENTGAWRRELREAEYGSLEEDRELLESLSPINSVEDIEAPLFVLHGANDPRVPVGEAEQIASALEERGVPVELLIFEDEGHGIAKRENRIEAYSQVVEFLDEWV